MTAATGVKTTQRMILDESASGDSDAYRGARLRHVAMPLGGIGAGQVAICGDGGLRQWQLFNQVNHQGFVPDSFFAIRVTSTEPPLNVIRLLQSREVAGFAADATPLVNDDFIPDQQRSLVKTFPGVERTTFQATYPFAHLRYEDEALPVQVELEAYSPFVPLDADASGLPAAIFTFTLRNPGKLDLQGAMAATLQNAVGWDGLTPITGNQCPLYGGNTNRLQRRAGATTLVMENPSLSHDHPGVGQMALTTLSPTARGYERWTTPEQFRRSMEGLNVSRQFAGQDSIDPRSYRNLPLTASGPSPAGTTWNGGLLTPFRLRSGEETRITFILSWHFPNRYVNFDQFGRMRDVGLSRFWLGNHYATRFADAVDVTRHVIDNLPSLDAQSWRWNQLLADSSLPSWLIETLAAQGSLIRSPTCFRTEDGKFYGFEGSLGVSTAMWNGEFGGSCPLNCTHVWNYEMALAKLFPQLERSMRETDFNFVQAPEGYIPHRTILPLYLRQLWAEPIGGPTNPALDGMLGAVLKTYREVSQGGGRTWLHELWPKVKLLVDYVIDHWDANGDGVLEGEQGNTYDIAFYGPNIYIGGLWLTALRAAEEMARLEDDEPYAERLHQLFERGRDRYDEILWNGEYYIQLLDESSPRDDQIGDGCLSDQLFGQWWAHLLDLGYILPEDHVKTTLRSIVRYNVREDFTDFHHDYRVFADRDDAGLLICTWPHGGRPEVPVRYCDEVWTGIEYQVAAHCIMEGMVDDGMRLLTALRGRYTGERRNPYNEIECGDHYSRAMAGWSVLDAISGMRYDATNHQFTFMSATGRSGSHLPLMAATGWGSITQEDNADAFRIEMTADYGEIPISTVVIDDHAGSNLAVTHNGIPVAATLASSDHRHTISLPSTITLQSGSSISFTLTNTEDTSMRSRESKITPS